MSYNITQTPLTNILSGNNPAVFVVSSSNANQIDHKYRADIYQNGIYLTTQKDFPNSAIGNFGKFDISEVASNLLTYDFLATGSIGFSTGSNSWTTTQVYFGEEFTDESGSFSQSLAIVSSSILTFIYSSLPFPDQVSVNMNDYYIDGTSAKRCLTKKNNNNFQTFANLNQWLYFYNVAGADTDANIFTYDQLGNSLGIYTCPNPNSTISGIQMFSTGYSQLQILPTSSYSAVSGQYPIITNKVAFYIVNFGNLGTSTIPVIDFDSSHVTDFDGTSVIDVENSPIEQMLFDGDGVFLMDGDGEFIETGTFVSGSNFSTIDYVYNLSSNCGKFAPGSIALYWVNTLGAIESYYFTLANQSSATKTQSQYKKVAGNLNSNGTYTYNSWQPQMINYYTEIQETYELNTNWLDFSNILYLKDLFKSSQVWMKLPSGQIFAVCVKDDTYQIIPKTVQKLYQLKLSVDFSFQDFSQRQ